MKAVWRMVRSADPSYMHEAAQLICSRGVNAALQNLKMGKEYIVSSEVTDGHGEDGVWKVTYTWYPSEQVTYHDEFFRVSHRSTRAPLRQRKLPGDGH